MSRDRCYTVRFVSELPEGHDFVVVEAPGRVVVALRESAVCPAVLEDAWTAYRALADSPRLALAV